MNRATPKSAKSAISAAALIAFCTLPAHATWLDNDPVCQSFGCVIVHNGETYSVYDNYDISASRRLAAGEPLIRRSNSDIPNQGSVSPVITGSLDTALSSAPLSDQGAILGIDNNRDGRADQSPIDANGSGFLDAGDSMDLFEVNTRTSIVGAATSYQRSFYITSTVDFSLFAQAISLNSNGAMSLSSSLGDVGFNYQIQTSGTDAGLSFGRRAQRGRVNRTVGNVRTISDLFGAPVEIVEFRRSIGKKNANTIAEQSIRFDYVYDFGSYDMSIGNGELDFEIEFDFYAR